MRVSTRGTSFCVSLSLVCLGLSGCATLIRNPVEDFNYDGGGPEKQKLSAAIINNNEHVVREILRGKSFLAKDFQLFDKGMNLNREHEESAYEILYLAITGRYWKNNPSADTDGVCRPQVVRALLDAQLPARPKDLARAAESKCPEVYGVIRERLSPEAVVSGTDAFLDSLEQRVRNGSIRTENEAGGWNEILRTIGSVGDVATKQRADGLTQLLDQHFDQPVRDSKSAARGMEDRYKSKFCSQPDLFTAIFTPLASSIESDCLYVLNGPLKVLQRAKGGILVVPMQIGEGVRDGVIFVKTKKAYVDEDNVGPILVKPLGVMSYNSVMGPEKTVRSFQYLEDVRLTRSSTGQVLIAPSN